MLLLTVKNLEKLSAGPSDAATCRMPSWLARSAAVADALQALLDAAVAETSDETNASSRLGVAAAKFDSVANVLEQDLIALAQQQPQARHGVHQVQNTAAQIQEQRG